MVNQPAELLQANTEVGRGGGGGKLLRDFIMCDNQRVDKAV